MGDVKIAPPEIPSSEASDLTRLEMAELSASKRNTVIYERLISDLRLQVIELTDQNKHLNKDAVAREQKLADLPLLKRGKTEMYVQFFISTVLMAVGGALISSFPQIENNIPWQFAVGWSLIGIGVLMGVIVRPLIMLVYYKYVAPKK